MGCHERPASRALGSQGATPLRVLDGLDLPGRHVVDPAVDVQLLLLGSPLDEGKFAKVLELESDVLLHDQPHPLLLRHLDVERPDLLVDPLARLEGVHQPDRNVLVLALVVVERLDPPAFVVTADDDVRDLQVADGELQDGGQEFSIRDRKSTRLNSSHDKNFYSVLFFLMIRPPPRATLLPYTTLFRSVVTADDDVRDLEVADGELQDGGQDFSI